MNKLRKRTNILLLLFKKYLKRFLSSRKIQLDMKLLAMILLTLIRLLLLSQQQKRLLLSVSATTRKHIRLQLMTFNKKRRLKSSWLNLNQNQLLSWLLKIFKSHKSKMLFILLKRLSRFNKSKTSKKQRVHYQPATKLLPKPNKESRQSL